MSAPNRAVRDRLRIAVQKSGRLAEPARALLASCGYAWRETRDHLFCIGETMPIDLLLVRDDDIPGLLADGTCDLGIVGRNVLLERAGECVLAGAPAPFREWRGLGFGACKLALAVPQQWGEAQALALDGLRIATSYPALLTQWLDERGIAAEVVTLSGSVEIAPRLGKADAICDLVSSGATLAANQLRATDVLLESEAVLAGPVAPFGDARAEIAALLLRRFDAVLGLRDSKLLLFQAASCNVPALMALLPDAEQPTVMRVDGTDRVALQAVCRGAVTWQRLEDLKRAGADALLVVPVERMLA
ncbi:ATP phosphoribosyltransferase [Lysobacter dokdonensis]|uniref:ATP phosphoribosyltransferase n=1 Tax=Noviluteimonas dokdonensis TaxID=414050 RepID=UPI000568B730